MNQQKTLMILFGATGDLASRKLYPALFRLYQKGYLVDQFAVIGTARRPWDNEHFRSVIQESIQHLVDNQEVAQQFASHFYYLSHNVNDTQHYVYLKNLADQLDTTYNIGGNRIFYLAMAPDFFGVIGHHLKDQGLLTNTGYNRLIIEKPFGNDYNSAAMLNEQLRHSFDENQIYRIDHYLGKEMIQNITAVRFANRVFEALWSKEHISNVQITLAEEVSVEDRGSYYDKSGALRDMIQNHMLQILALVAMEPPASFEDVRTQKINVLEALHPYTPQEVQTHFVRGQYGPSSDGKKTGYRQDPNVADFSDTETFVAGKILIDTPRWEGVPFYVRSGKSMGEKKTIIHVQFKDAASPLFSHADTTTEKPKQNRISIHISPKEGFCFVINSKAVGQNFHLQTSHLEKLYGEEFSSHSPEAYERLLYDCMSGDMTNFTHWEEVAASWKFIDRIRSAWDQQPACEFPNYAAGTMGPRDSFKLLEDDHFEWI